LRAPGCFDFFGGFCGIVYTPWAALSAIERNAPWLVVAAACAACALKTEPARGEMRRLWRFPRMFIYLKQKTATWCGFA